MELSGSLIKNNLSWFILLLPLFCIIIIMPSPRSLWEDGGQVITNRHLQILEHKAKPFFEAPGNEDALR